MTIKVLVDTIDYKPVLDYYNSNKEAGEPPLKILNRKEGGFEIELPENQWKKDYMGFVDANGKIRQLRWSEGRLVSNYISFTAKQGILLYEALVHSLPPGSVVIE